jgi:hypothetical protein
MTTPEQLAREETAEDLAAALDQSAGMALGFALKS